MTTTNNPAYTDEQGGFGAASSRYRGVLSYSKSSTSGNAKTTISWTAKVQMKNAWYYGVGIKVSGADDGTATGYLTSNPGSSWATVKTITGSFPVTGTTSSQTKNLTFTAYGTNVSGYGSAGGSVSETVKITIPALKKYTITFKPNGGTGGPSSQSKYHGKNITITNSVPTRTGYTFQGWARSSSGDVVYKAGTTCTMNSDQTLYAIWKINTYTVSYNANGGSGGPSSQTKTYGKALKVTSSKPTRTDYNFTKWNTTSSGSGVSYSSGGTIPANTDSAGNSTNKSFTLYAQWEKATCTITFNSNGGTGSGVAVPNRIGDSIVIPNATEGNAGTKTGYNFAGWSQSATANTATYSVGMDAVFNSDTVLYAVWSPVYLTYPYGTLSSNNASSYNIKTITIQAETGDGAFYYQYENFKFVGWYLTNKNQASRDVIAKNWLLPYSAAIPANVRTDLKNINSSNAPTSNTVIMAMYRDISPSTVFSVSNNSVRPADRSEASFNSYIDSVLNNNAFTNIGGNKAIFGYIEYNSSTANLTYVSATLQAVGGSPITLNKDTNFFLKSRGNILFFRIVDNSIQESTKYKFTLDLKDTLGKPVDTTINISYKQQIIDIYKSPAPDDGRFKIETSGDITVYGNIKTSKASNDSTSGRIILPNNTGLRYTANDNQTEVTVGYMSTDNGIYHGNAGYNLLLLGANAGTGTTILNSSGDLNLAGTITTKGHSSPIGSCDFDYNTVRTNTETVYWQDMFKLTEGVYVIYLHARFAGTSSGYRSIGIAALNSSTATPTDDNLLERTHITNTHSGSNYARIAVSTVVAPVADTWYKAKLHQSSGSTLSCRYDYGYVRII